MTSQNMTYKRTSPPKNASLEILAHILTITVLIPQSCVRGLSAATPQSATAKHPLPVHSSSNMIMWQKFEHIETGKLHGYIVGLYSHGALFAAACTYVLFG